MKNLVYKTFVFSFLCLPVLVAAEPELNWPQWRGPHLDGTSRTAKDLPVEWSPTQNVRWQVKLPSWSAATPIVWGGTVFVTSAEEGFIAPRRYRPAKRSVTKGKTGPPRWTRHEAPLSSKDAILLLAVNRRDGSVRWSRTVGDRNRVYRKQNLASPSPVTDGRLVWVMTGAGRLTCLNFAGKEVWNRDLEAEYGPFGQNHGYASSPLLADGRLYLQVLHGMKTDEPSYVLAIDKTTGRTIWKVDRPSDAPFESADNYSTPIMVTVNGEKRLAVWGADYVTGHNTRTGKEVWRMGGFNPKRERFYRTIASSIAVGDTIYTTSSRGRPFVAFRPAGTGDITSSAMLWKNDFGSDVPTPTTDGKRIFVVKGRGVLTALNCRDGSKVAEPKRLEPGTYSASPLLADGKLYATNEDGVTSVVSADSLEILAVNRLEGRTLASPAAVGNQLFIRTAEYLYCLANQR